MEKDDEAERIYQEVARRRARAFELAVHKLIGDLHATIRHYPDWLTNASCRDYVCSLVTDICRHGDRGVSFTLRGRNYVFEFRTRPNYLPDGGDGAEFADLDLVCDSKKVLQLRMVSDSWDRNWSAVDVSAFIEGDWINDFRILEERIEEEQSEREKRKRENPETLNALKKDFGID